MSNSTPDPFPTKHLGPATREWSERMVFEGAWLRRLAGQLVRDPHRADDAVQATLVAAWNRAAGEAPPPRPWLARVLRNFVLQESRSEARRKAREAQVAQREAESPQPSTLERLELQRRVVDAIESLNEPYRNTIVLRFLDDLAPRAIATRTGTPVKTVQTRIKRGLAQLRGRLDDVWNSEQDGGTDWRLALLALPDLPSRTDPLLVGVTAMGTMTKASLGAALVLALVAGVLLQSNPPSESAGSPELPIALAPRTQEFALPRVPAGYSGESGIRRGESKLANTLEAKTRNFLTVEGLVLDLEDSPVADVRLELASKETWSDESGRFRLSIALPAGHLAFLDKAGADLPTLETVLPYPVRVSDPNWTGLGATQSMNNETVLLVVPATHVRGQVLNEFDQPLAGAKVSFELPLSLSLQFPSQMGRFSDSKTVVETNAEGEFRLEGIAQIEGALLSASKPGYLSAQIELTLPDREVQVLRLRRPLVTERSLVGRVLGPDGSPFAKALVSAQSHSVLSDERGDFLVQVPATEAIDLGGERIELTAVAEGLLPARVSIDLGTSLPTFVELRFGRPCLTIEGQVVDDQGRPIKDALIWAGDLTYFGLVTKELPGFHLDSRQNIEDYLAHRGEYFQGVYTRTDAQGHFLLEGLLERDYPLFALDESNLAFVDVGEISAGSNDLWITIAPPVAPVPVAGRVIGHDGRPIQDAIVAVSSTYHFEQGLPSLGQHSTSDANGRFHFDGLLPDNLILLVGGHDIANRPGGYPIKAEDNVGHLELEVGRVVRFRVDGSQSNWSAATIRVEDRQGQSLQLQREVRGEWFVSPFFPLEQGQSGVVEVEDNASTLVVEVEGMEPLHLPLHLERGRVAQIDIP